MPKNYYIILGIPSDSSLTQIKSAYRRLAKEFHPDHYGHSSPFLNIQEAYSVLSDPARRRSYDNNLQENRQFRGRPEHVETLRERTYHGEIEPLIPEQELNSYQNASTPAAFHPFQASLGSLLEQWFQNFTETGSQGGERPENVTVVMHLTQEQAFRGGHVRLAVPVHLECPGCNGRGGIGPYECWRCSGQGQLSGECPIIISYPPGITDTHTVQLSLERYGLRNLYLTVQFRISAMR